jgi:heptosyltransferase II
MNKKILIVQTAFLGDVVLATAIVEKLHAFFPYAAIDFLLRKGNEGVLSNHPYLNQCLIWDKKNGKLIQLMNMLQAIRARKYDHVINLHRFTSSGMLSAFSSAREVVGFDKNPLSIFFSKSIAHQIGNGMHEVQRNQQLIAHLTDTDPMMPKLHPSQGNRAAVSSILVKYQANANYCTIAPASVWYTKQWPIEKWIALIEALDPNITIFVLGAPADVDLAEDIVKRVNRGKVISLAGELQILETAVLMKGAKMNYVNDSAPLHIASAMNAPVTAVFCSTVPEFGFGPLSDHSILIQTQNNLSCRPCGIHGHAKCPIGTFECANSISVNQFKLK